MHMTSDVTLLNCDVLLFFSFNPPAALAIAIGNEKMTQDLPGIWHNGHSFKRKPHILPAVVSHNAPIAMPRESLTRLLRLDLTAIQNNHKERGQHGVSSAQAQEK